MTGSYQGGYHGSGDFGYGGGSFAENAAVHENLKANAILNGSQAAFVWSGWEPAGFQLSAGGTNGGAGVPSGGPGSPGVGSAPTRGPGAAGGSSGGGFAGTGPGGGKVRAPGGEVYSGTHLLPIRPPDKTFVTPLTAAGHDWHIDRGYSDAQDVESRVGDGELGSPLWVYGWVVTAADAFKTFKESTPLGEEVIQPLGRAVDAAMQWDRQATSRLSDWWGGVLTDGGSFASPTGPVVIDKPAFGQTFNPSNF